MKSRITSMVLTGLAAVVVLAGVVTFGSEAALALDPARAVDRGVNAAGGNNQRQLRPTIEIVVNILLFILGAISVIMIVIGGIRYTLSNGDSTQITSAKNTVLYAVIGLVVALLAYAIVKFVIDQFVR